MPFGGQNCTVAVMSEQILELRAVSKRFMSRNGEEVLALDAVSFDVRRGEFFVIIGPSGSGKTSLLDLIAGFERPTEGFVLANGKPIEKPGWQRAVVFQEHGLFPWLTVAKNIEFGLKMKRVSANERAEMVANYVQMIGLSGFENKYPRELSGGMKQRVGIARALAVQSELIVMDEPFGALDPQTRTEMQDELLRIWAQDRRTIVLVTHSIEEALKLGDRIAVMSPRPGRLRKLFRIDRPRPRSVLDDPELLNLNIELHAMLFESSLRKPMKQAKVARNVG